LISDLKSVGQAKNQRAMVEKDVELLHNRIKMLQMEEVKAMKKIEETRKKAEKIMELRRENDKKYEQKIKEQIKFQKMLRHKKNGKYTEDQQRKRNINSKIMTIKKQRKAKALVIRKCGAENDMRK
jgi:hypothetical protein